MTLDLYNLNVYRSYKTYRRGRRGTRPPEPARAWLRSRAHHTYPFCFEKDLYLFHLVPELFLKPFPTLRGVGIILPLKFKIHYFPIIPQYFIVSLCIKFQLFLLLLSEVSILRTNNF